MPASGCYPCPGEIRFVDSLPRNALGKVVKSALVAFRAHTAIRVSAAGYVGTSFRKP